MVMQSLKSRIEQQPTGKVSVDLSKQATRVVAFLLEGTSVETCRCEVRRRNGGLDATVVKRVDAHPLLKARARQWYYTWAAISAFYRHYLRDPVRFWIGSSPAKVVRCMSRGELGSYGLAR